MRRATLSACALFAALAAPAFAQTAPDPAAAPAQAAVPTASRNGREIYERFREGLADPTCEAGVSTRWRQHFATAPKRLATHGDDTLPLFGYVVDALREAHLPTEYALIPFVESGYKPGARSSAGPAGLWQMIALTARNHRVPIREGYDGRLSPVDSTQAAVRYLKTLHGMFAGDWRLTVMAYNAGEYRILGALKRSGQTARNAKPEQLPGLSDITQAYVRKLHALSCLMEQADDREEWLRALDRPVPRLQAVTVPDDVADLAAWSRRSGHDAAQLQRLNPVFAGGRIGRAGGARAPVLGLPATAVGAVDGGATETTAVAAAPLDSAAGAAAAVTTSGDASAATAAGAEPRRHTVARGDNAWTIARRYGVRVADLLQRNGLAANAVLKPGQALLIDAPAVAP
ncbi:lytic transglycosylase domain-containing protein [Lysobacter silvisoli]|uniref:LysM peptidoglycan-binding domain-containing protein n=1 Tax=Lysobacter silvisoli TaxID=2293254 RepID=A0A371K1V4_9GAMM|nr:lytic transglycosylase domain-containing protein [Lysobacter silvisoli]RDZ27909.1 LysM peptidoglycan-binding domain-containing protein [Lysobacter silvisoli]